MIEVRYQPSAHRAIQHALEGSRVPHALLFHGPDGVGKELFATGLARRLLCSNPATVTLNEQMPELADRKLFQDACKRCDDCRLVEANAHPDLNLVYRQLNRTHPSPEIRSTTARDLSIGVLRHFLIDRVGLTPNRGQRKVFIVREADRMKTEAQNALLKTLEEPPASTILILLASSRERMLSTVLSRCQSIEFGPLPSAFIQEKLADISADLSDDQAAWYTASSYGSIGTAMTQIDDDLYGINSQLLSFLANPPGRSESLKWWEETAKAIGARYRKRDTGLTEAEAARQGVQTLIMLAANIFTTILRAKAENEGAQPHVSDQPQFSRFSCDLHSALAAVDRLRQAERQLSANAYQKLVIESLISDLPLTNQPDHA